jgi:GT2 family glycosyltransferase
MLSELAVVLVSWNTRDLTLDGLRTLCADLETGGPQAEIWVVDNASRDGTPDAVRRQYPGVRLVAQESNLGFAGGNNVAMRAMGFGTQRARTEAGGLPRAVYLLNSDTLTHPGATRALYDTLFTLPRAGVVGARLSYADGSFQHSAFHFPGLGQLWADLLPMPGRFHDSRWNGRYPRERYFGSEPFPVDHTLGATMMLRREVIQQTGMFDEQYFMYCEEIDWSIRIRRAGWEIYCVPAAHVTHLAGQSTVQVRPQSIVNLWRSRFRLFEKHYSRPKRFLARQLIRLGIRRQITMAQQAFSAGKLTAAERDALVQAYRTVQTF